MMPSNGEQMMSCPKCGFEQPVDQYCAKCGVDMAKTFKKSPGINRLFKNPTAVVGIVALLGGIGFIGYRSSTQQIAAIEESFRGALDARATEARAKSRLSAKVSASVAENLKVAESALVLETDVAQDTAGLQQSGPALDPQPEVEADVPTLRKAGKSALHAIPTSQTNTSPTAAPGLLVVFAWAEVAREWLQAMGTAEPGFHQVPGLEVRLRQSTGSFRIVDVTRRRLTDDAEPVLISKGDQSVFFEPVSVNSKSISGGFTAQFKSALGEIRAPASAAASLMKGSGAIVPMGPSNSTQGTEIVVFILPRWEND